MRLISFNVNSINAYLKKGLSEQLLSYNPDILSLQELKLSAVDPYGRFPLEIRDMEASYTVSKVKKGYSGTACLYNKTPLSVSYGLIDGKYDEEGRAVTLEYDSFYLVNLYTPNSGEELKRLSFRMQYEKDLRDYLSSLMKKKEVIVCGDLNVANEEIDLKNPSSNHHSPGFTDEERREFKNLLSIGLVDTFRTLHPEERKYSYWSYLRNARANNAGWRIDYFLVSKKLMEKVRNAEILNDVYGSDHCPVLLDIDI